LIFIKIILIKTEIIEAVVEGFWREEKAEGARVGCCDLSTLIKSTKGVDKDLVGDENE
jgi:hypothetical protein